MLELVDSTLEAFFRATVPLSALDVDVSFEPPDREWSAKLTRPTVNLFLWDIRRSAGRAQAGREELERDGQLVRRAPLPRVELRFLLTAWTSDHGDERALLAGTMRTVLAHAEIPATFVVEPLRALPPLVLLMARTDDQQPDIGGLLDGQIKPGLVLTVITAVETDVYTPAGPPVEVFELTVSSRDRTVVDPSLGIRRVAGEIVAPGAVGAAVTSPRGTAVVNDAGRFVIRAITGDEIVISTEPVVTVIVPPEGGVRVGEPSESPNERTTSLGEPSEPRTNERRRWVSRVSPRTSERGRRVDLLATRSGLTCARSCTGPTSRSHRATSPSSRSRWPTPPTSSMG